MGKLEPAALMKWAAGLDMPFPEVLTPANDQGKDERDREFEQMTLKLRNLERKLAAIETIDDINPKLATSFYKLVVGLAANTVKSAGERFTISKILKRLEDQGLKIDRKVVRTCLDHAIERLDLAEKFSLGALSEDGADGISEK